MFGSSGHLTFNIARLAIALKTTGVDISVASAIAEEEPGLIDSLLRNEIHWYNIPTVTSLKAILNPYSLNRIRKIMLARRWDIVHVHSFHHLILCFMAKLLSNSDARIYITVHTTGTSDSQKQSATHGYKFENLAVTIEAILIRFLCSRAIVVARSAASKLNAYSFVRDFIVNIPNGIDLSYFDSLTSDCSSQSKGESSINIITVGGLIPRKGHKYFIECIRKLVDSNIVNIKASIVGDGPLRQKLRRQIAQLNLKNYVVLHGHIQSYKEMYCLLKSSDIYLFTSFAELFPFAILEAMSARKPIVSTNVGGINEMVKEGVTGYLVDTDKVDNLSAELCERVVFLIENPDKARELGELARELVEKKFAIKEIAAQIVAEYKKRKH